MSAADGTPKLSIVDVLAIVRALHERPMSEDELLRRTALVRSKYYRLRALMLEHLQIDIAHDSETGLRSIADYGLINRRKL